MLRDLLGLEEDGDEVVVRAHEHRLRTSLQGTEYRLRSKETRNILVTPMPSTSSVLKGVSGIGLSRRFSSWSKTSWGTLPVTSCTRPLAKSSRQRTACVLRSSRSRKRRPGQKRRRTKPIGRSTRPFSLPFLTLQARTAKPPRARAYSRNFGLKTVAVAVCESTTVFMLSKMSAAVVPPKKRRQRSMQRRNEPIAWLSVNSM